jgi:hypothetical protein
MDMAWRATTSPSRDLCTSERASHPFTSRRQLQQISRTSASAALDYVLLTLSSPNIDDTTRVGRPMDSQTGGSHRRLAVLTHIENFPLSGAQAYSPNSKSQTFTTNTSVDVLPVKSVPAPTLDARLGCQRRLWHPQAQGVNTCS